MEAGIRLARWLLQELPEAPTHLKLQKLCFYAYGFAAGNGYEAALGRVAFEAWAHGPVCRPVWERYRDHGRAPIVDGGLVPPYIPAAEAILRSVVEVYGQMTAWHLREQSHLERPWIDYAKCGGRIPNADIVEHFGPTGNVAAPAYVFGRGGGTLDGIPSVKFSSVQDMAAALAPAE